MKKLLTTLSIFVLITTGNLNIGCNITQNHLVKKNLLTNKTTTIDNNNHDFTFNNWIKNNKGEIFAKSDDGLYKYVNDENTFIKMEGINEGIKDLKFDIQDNIYGLTEDGIYKCLATNTKFIKMKVLTNSTNYLFTNLKIDQSNNVYVWSNKDGVYRCLSDNIEFNKIGGIHLEQQHV